MCAAPAVLQPFWDATVQAASYNYWTPLLSDACDESWSSWSGCNVRMLGASWFTARLLTGSHVPRAERLALPLHTTSLLDKDGEEPPRKKPKKAVPAARTRKFRLYPTPKQRTMLNEWFNIARWTYNKCVGESKKLYPEYEARKKRRAEEKAKLKKEAAEARKAAAEARKAAGTRRKKRTKEEIEGAKIEREVAKKRRLKEKEKKRAERAEMSKKRNAEWEEKKKDPNAEPSESTKLSRLLRTKFVNNDSVPVWALKTPYEVRSGAMRDFKVAWKTNLKLVAEGKKDHFDMKFRSKKAASESIYIGNKFYKNSRFYTKFTNNSRFRSTERLPEKSEYDMRLQRTRLGRFYLCVPLPATVRERPPPAGESQARVVPTPAARIISLDPGVRTFQTGYDPSGYTLEFGSGDMSRIVRLCRSMDDLQSRWYQHSPVLTHHRRYRLKRAWLCMIDKIRNLIRDIHYKTAKFLCANYDVIFLPTFETQQMVSGVRKLHSKVARAMCTWSHYSFKQHLLFKSSEYPGCRVSIVGEEYTSKTCGRCGTVNPSNSSKTFTCRAPGCRYRADRDHNGARNILLKNLHRMRGVSTPWSALGPTPFSSENAGLDPVAGTACCFVL